MRTHSRPDENVMVLPTPFHERTARACQSGHWKSWSGYRVVDEYTNTELEYFAVRNQCGVFDLSPMIKYRITGRDAEAFLNRLVTRDVYKLRDNRVAYVLFCNQMGHTLDDGTLFRFSAAEFQLCTQDRHLPWLLDSAIGFEVTVDDITDTMAALAIQGPTSCAVLDSMGLAGLAAMPPFGVETFDFYGMELTVSRTGFTGDLGYELWLNPDCAVDLWDKLMVSGANYGLVPFGSAALEMLRLEAGYIMPHIDFLPASHIIRHNRGRSPLELGFARLVDFDKGFFNGRQALLKERATGSRYQLVGLEVEGNKPSTDAWVYQGKRKKTGYVTSAMWSPTCKRNIALAMLQSGFNPDRLWVDIYTRKELKWNRSRMRCTLVPRTFFNPARRLAVPAGIS